MASKPTKQACPHQFGEGYYDLLNGTRVKRTQVCKDCGEKRVTDLTKEPEPPLSGKPLGMKPGGTFQNGA